MVKGKKTYWWGGILLAVSLVSTVCIGGQILTAPSGNEERADIVRIDVLRKFGALTKPEVLFLHDRHTEALQKQGKDCKVCHLSKGKEIPGSPDLAVSRIDVLSPKFRRMEDTARKDVMDTYHKFCIECHTEMRTAGDVSGPITCGECHKPASVSSAWKAIGFDKSLHWRHAKTMDKKCEKCHHDYDEKEKKKVYVKGKEGSCRYCHKEVAQEKRLALRDAAHLDCISCHRDRLAQRQSAGPIQCSGCHLDANQKKIEKAADIPRMERNQPDETLVSTGIVSDNGPANVVAFNHKAHEGYNDSCRVCHHESMDKCSKCHTLTGAKEGGQVKLEQTFHLTSSDKSCVGCHVTRQRDPKCAGCHVMMEKNRRPNDAACLKCHVTPSPEVAGAVKSGDEKRIKALAHKMIQDRPEASAPVAEKDIPEKSAHQLHGEAISGSGTAPPQDREPAAPGSEGQQDGRLLPRSGHHPVPGMPPQRPGHHETAEMRLLPRPVLG